MKVRIVPEMVPGKGPKKEMGYQVFFDRLIVHLMLL